MTEKNESSNKKKKIQDLTGGAYQPSEQFKVIADGTVVRLEDPTHPKTQEEVEAEKEARKEPITEESDCQTICQITNQISSESE